MTTKELIDSAQKAVTKLLDTFYTPWYKLQPAPDNVTLPAFIVVTENSSNICMLFQHTPEVMWYTETFILDKKNKSTNRCSISGYYDSPEELAVQVYKNINGVELSKYLTDEFSKEEGEGKEVDE